MSKQETKEIIQPEVNKLMCGIVMPISEIDGCSENHWKDIYSIISQATEKAGFNSNLVSNSDDVGVIQKRIIQNLYDNPIVVCDVSCKNPNVMFELGIRLAFDKPTIIIKDDKTKYSFDTSPIEHLEYPRDLRFSKIVEFKERLAEKIIQTHKKATEDENFSTFLKHFGSFKIAKIETEEISKEDYILEEIKGLREMVSRNNRYQTRNKYSLENERNLFNDREENSITICFGDKTPNNVDSLLSEILNMKGVERTEYEKLSEDHSHIEVRLAPRAPKSLIIKRLESITGKEVEYIR